MLIKAFEALWQVIAVGLLLGAGLPALFALGLRALYGTSVPVSPPGDAALSGAAAASGYTAGGPPVTGSSSSVATLPIPAPSVAGRVIAGICFTVCILAVTFGIVVIVFGKQLFG